VYTRYIERNSKAIARVDVHRVRDVALGAFLEAWS